MKSSEPSTPRPRAIKAYRVLTIACRVALGLLFLYAGIPKVFNPSVFLMDVRGFMLAPNFLAPSIALVLPMLEVIIGICLLAGIWTRPSSLIGALLLIVFLFAIGAAMARGLDIECGCFGKSDSKVGVWKLVEDIIFLALTLLVFFTAARKKSAFGQEG